MKKESAKLCRGLGLLLLALALFRSFSLGGGSVAQSLILLLGFLAAGLLAAFFAQKEGGNRQLTEVLLLPIGLALFLRGFLLPHQTLDYQNFLMHWVQFFRDNGGFSALCQPVGNYNVPYLYLLALISYLPVSDLYLIKLASIMFDVLLAWGGWRLAKQVGGDSGGPAAFSVLLLLPTVVLNGSCWGQCDAIWAALCVHALADALDRHPLRSVSLMGLAFAFKLQAIFILPLWGALWLCGKVKFRHLWAFPGVFALTMVPALLAGKPVADILGVYVGQTTDSVSWQTLNYNSPSVVTLFPVGHQPGPWGPAVGIGLAFLLVLVVLGLLIWKRKAADSTAFILGGIVLSLGVPFFLPYMHERYFYLGGVLLAVWACTHRRAAVPALGAELASLGGYHAYLAMKFALPITIFGLTWTQPVEGLLMLFALGWSAAALWRKWNGCLV